MNSGASSSSSSRGATRRGGVKDAASTAAFYRMANEKEMKGFGAEGVRDALNSALAVLISTVERHGGDVLRIAGDALIVLFHQVGWARDDACSGRFVSLARILGGVARADVGHRRGDSGSEGLQNEAFQECCCKPGFFLLDCCSFPCVTRL